MAEGLEAAIDRYHAAVAEFINGNPEPQREVYSHRDDVVLANPLGPPACGWDAVSEAMDRASAQVREGEIIERQLVTRYATNDLAYTVEIERARAKFGGKDEFMRSELRVTTIFRREHDVWKVVHRHADPITTPRPIESVTAS